MIELPEAITIGRQVEQILAGRKVTNVYGATYLHKFTFFNGTPDEYRNLLVGKEVRSAIGKGFFVDVCFDEIGSALKIKELQRDKRELLESLEMYYKVFFLEIGRASCRERV